MRRQVLTLLFGLLSLTPGRAQEGETAEERATIALDQVADIEVEWGEGVGRPVRSLKISNGKISDAILAHLKAFKGLRTLEIGSHFREAMINSSGLSAIADLTELRTLRLSGEVIDDTAMGHLKKLTRLQVLELRWTKVSDAGLVHLKGMTDLRELALSGTKLTDAGAKQLTGLVQLRELHLGNTAISDDGLGHLKGMTQLRKLHLDRTKVGGRGLAHLSDMTELTLLDLHSTAVTDKGLTHLPEARQLRWVSVSETAAALQGRRDCPKGRFKLQVSGLVGRLFDAKTGKAIGEPLRHSVDRKGGKINCWAFSPDGTLLAIGASYDSRHDGRNTGARESLGQICIWDTSTGNLVETSKDHYLGYLRGVAFHKDSKTILFQAERAQEDGK